MLISDLRCTLTFNPICCSLSTMFINSVKKNDGLCTSVLRVGWERSPSRGPALPLLGFLREQEASLESLRCRFPPECGGSCSRCIWNTYPNKKKKTQLQERVYNCLHRVGRLIFYRFNTDTSNTVKFRRIILCSKTKPFVASVLSLWVPSVQLLHIFSIFWLVRNKPFTAEFLKSGLKRSLQVIWEVLLCAFCSYAQLQTTWVNWTETLWLSGRYSFLKPLLKQFITDGDTSFHSTFI